MPSAVLKALMLAALALCALPTAIAQQSNAFVVPYTGTLKKVNDSGVLQIGHRENSPPFAFLDKRGKPIGYALDLCAVVVEEIVAELRKDIRVEYRPVTPENRFDLLNSGAIDLECGSTTNNLELKPAALHR
jgi:glutamate/aspartate transport system substrate-binding protein